MIGLPELQRRMVGEVQKRVVERAKLDYNKTCVYVNYEASDALELVSIFDPLSQIKRSQIFESSGILIEDVFHQEKKFENKNVVKAILLNSESKPNKEIVELLRESFLRIVRARYWEMVEEGHLPATGKSIIELLRSIDICLDNTTIPLHDWKFLQPNIGCTEDDVWYDDVLGCVDWVLPDSVTWDNELLYELHFKRQETAYHICHGFIDGHVYAQEKIAMYHGDEQTVDTPEEATVILESIELVAAAQKELKRMSPDLIKHIKTMFVADNLINQQQMYIHKLIAQGILASTEAEEILHQLEEDADKVNKARKRRARMFSPEAKSSTLAGDFHSGSTSETIEFGAGKHSEATLGSLNPNPSLELIKQQ